MGTRWPALFTFIAIIPLLCLLPGIKYSVPSLGLDLLFFSSCAQPHKSPLFNCATQPCPASLLQR